MGNREIIRCGWCGEEPLYVEYHDKEWGKLVEDDKVLFEFLVLESAQAGLSWWTVLQRREGYRRAFAGFDPEAVAEFGESDVERILEAGEVIRHRGKIEAAINNAKLFLEIQREFGSFYNYIVTFLPEGTPIVNSPERIEEVAATTPLSDRLSKEMKGRGFKFWGSTICYAFLQATGFVNDHIATCSFR